MEKDTLEKVKNPKPKTVRQARRAKLQLSGNAEAKLSKPGTTSTDRVTRGKKTQMQQKEPNTSKNSQEAKTKGNNDGKIQDQTSPLPAEEKVVIVSNVIRNGFTNLLSGESDQILEHYSFVKGGDSTIGKRGERRAKELRDQLPLPAHKMSLVISWHNIPLGPVVIYILHTYCSFLPISGPRVHQLVDCRCR